jgi:hypothetical protein
MEKMKTYEFKSSFDDLSAPLEGKDLPADLHQPLGTMAAEIASLAQRKPFSIYVTSGDELSEVRDTFGYNLTKMIIERIPTAMMVDCDFMSTGLSGIVPQKDAMGFLDLLLYGSSLGAITQQAANGVLVVGAGSFSVTKKHPFVMDAFQNARRYLLNQARCVVFCGPAVDDDGRVHPLVEHVDLPIVVSYRDNYRGAVLEPVEEKVSSGNVDDVWSVRIQQSSTLITGGVAEVPYTAGPRERDDAPPHEDEVREPEREAPEPKDEEAVLITDPPESEDTPEREVQANFGASAPAGPEWEEETGKVFQGSKSSISALLPRIITAVLGVFLIAFVAWWLYLTKSVRQQAETPARPVERVGAGPAPTQEGGMPAADTTAAEGGTGVDVAVGVETPPVPAQGDGGGVVETPRDAGIVTGAGQVRPIPELQPPVSSQVGRSVDGVRLFTSLREFAGSYVIHISSFQTMKNAQEEALYLYGRGHPVLMTHVDLKEKGKWYRVYVGPFDTSQTADSEKIKLDEVPRVKFTRIKKVPG